MTIHKHDIIKRYLSYGGGVNSTALMLLLEQQGLKFESIFVDHGVDYPWTYEYVKYLQAEGHPITVIKPCVDGCHTIEEYWLKYRTPPTRTNRWCTWKFKIEPFLNYIKHPAIVYVGISADERERRRRSYPGIEDVTIEHPLIDLGIDRLECERMILRAGLKLPRKSGCWCCPFHPETGETMRIFGYHDLLERRKRLEKINQQS